MRIIDYIGQGGPIMYLLLFLNIVGFTLMLVKFYSFFIQKKLTTQTGEQIGQKVLTNSESDDSNTLIELSKQELSAHISDMEKGLNTIKIIATISPLLGLLGTVIGVLMAFKVMAQTGLNDPSSFAEGISMALITTVGGMIVSIPHYIGHNYLLGSLDALEASLEKKVLNKVLS